MKRSKFSTSTVVGPERLVPWLAAAGPLGYSPENPPVTDYFFQYSWILPGIFEPKENLRHHFCFGIRHKRDADFLFQFWNNARRGQVQRKYLELGSFSKDQGTAPIAVYDHTLEYGNGSGWLFIQHGSYLSVPVESQPNIESGQVLLYRGVQRARKFRHLGFAADQLDPVELGIWRAYLELQAKMLSDSVLSFNTVHDRAKRCETEHIRDRSWLSDTMATQAGLDIGVPGFAQDLWEACHQSFSLEPWVAQRKFGPHYVIFKTPISNIRLTTFFAGEAEARVIDPSLLEVVEATGCKVEAIPARKAKK